MSRLKEAIHIGIKLGLVTGASYLENGIVWGGLLDVWRNNLSFSDVFGLSTFPKFMAEHLLINPFQTFTWEQGAGLAAAGCILFEAGMTVIQARRARKTAQVAKS